jgi:hypothetical protein
MKKPKPDRIAWAALAAGAAYAAGWAIDKAARRGWRSVTGDEPPESPESPDTDWKDALLWTAATSVALGLGRLLSRRVAAYGWQRVAGETPPA